MLYYQILKKRRLDLNLSVQDIAIQTHLAPEFIRAIEDNNLDVFASDLSYVRYFVHAYADAIGVNWMAIAPEVDYMVNMYAHARNQAITQAQQIYAAQMQAAQMQKRSAKNKTKSAKTKKKRKKRKISVFQNSAVKISRMLKWDSKNRMSKLLIAAAIVFVGVLGGLNYVLTQRNLQQRQTLQAQKQQELKDKEAETQKLASALQSQRDQEAVQSGTAPLLTQIPDTVNQFYVTNIVGVSPDTNLTFNCASPLQVNVSMTTVEEVPIENSDSVAQTESSLPSDQSDPAASQAATQVQRIESTQALFSEEVNGTLNKSLQVKDNSIIHIELSGYVSDDKISIGGTEIPINNSVFTNGSGSLSLHVLSALPKTETQDSASDGQENPEAQPAEDQQAEQTPAADQALDDGQAVQSEQVPVSYDIYGNAVYSDEYGNLYSYDANGEIYTPDPAILQSGLAESY